MMSKIRVTFLLASLLLLFNCKSLQIRKKLQKEVSSSFFNEQFTGFLVINSATKDTLINHNGHKFFTPASNTKIATLYTGLQTLPKYIPAFKYQINADTITIKGTGNPMFLHPFFNDSTALKMVKNYKKINIIIHNFTEKNLGSGWAWDDYDAYYSAERNAFPIYGNIVTVSNKEKLKVTPKIFEKNVHLQKSRRARDLTSNEFYYDPNNTEEEEIPIIMNTSSLKKMWKAILPSAEIAFLTKNSSLSNIAYVSIPTDTLYQRMMYQSDNFLAEQILITASSTLSDTLNPSNIRKYMLTHQLKEIDQPRWVDGSGLSRYNLFTPASFVAILDKMHTEIPKKRLFNLFPVGGVSGTLKKWYKGNPRPYIFAKSGSLSNNYSLSGYLVTNSGKTLIFSFMNNHYRKSTTQLKKQMQKVFEWLRDHY